MRGRVAVMAMVAVWAFASACSTPISTPATDETGVEVGSASDTVGETATDTNQAETLGDLDQAAAADLPPEDAAADVHTGSTPDDGQQDATPSCPSGATCAMPCCPAAACDQAGVCQCPEPVCDDQNPCTVDLCADATCVHLPAQASLCDDGDPCTLADACTSASCAGSPKDCNDGDPCTADSCAGGGCVHAPESATSCDDANACTADSCATGKGCTHDGALLDFSPCDDGNSCTIADTCLSGGCASWQAAWCDDDNVCTADSCDIMMGCMHLPVAGTCSDDGNPCTVDTCSTGKCGLAKPDGTPCDSGTGCDVGVVCKSGSCTGGSAVWFHEFKYSPAAVSAVNTTGILHPTTSGLEMRAWNGIVQWALPGPVGQVAALASGWALQHFEQGTTDIFDGAGKKVKSVPMPSAVSPLSVGPGVLLAGTGNDLLLEFNASAGAGDSLVRVSEAGIVLQTWQAGLGVEGAGIATPLASGRVAWAVFDNNAFGKSRFALYLLEPNSGTAAAKVGPFMQPTWFTANADGPLMVSEAGDGSLYLAQWRRSESDPGIVEVFVWHTSEIGAPIWVHNLEFPVQGIPMQGAYVAVVALSDGTVEVLAGPYFVPEKNEYDQGFTSWRLAQDGRLLWSRDEDQRRRMHAYPTIAGVGSGVGGWMWNFDGMFLRETLTRSDAYGNLTCAESGPCWDKPATWCDDGDPCTNDLCGAQWKGCHHEPFPDGAPCMPGKSCKKGVCG